ncbi:MAG: amidase [Gammaproteobacteria bacterium]|nr:amidase [Gammaproteobacteria bacterium]
MQSENNAMPKEKKNTISRRKLLGVLGTGIIAPGVIGCTSREDSAVVYGDELTPELYHSSVRALAAAVRSRDVSSVEVVQAFLDRIDAVNTKINAVVALSGEEALDAANKADAQLSRGEVTGPLHGVPMTIKDSIDTAGTLTTYGTKGRSTFVPTKDATIVARLKSSGAILMGKTNTPEFTLSYETGNDIYGVTNNPYDLTRTPGGSSGGASAILAAGGSPFDIGSDYGGSIRLPSHCTGIAGIKPTSGRVPRTGHGFPFGGLLDAFQQLGPMARRVTDLSLLLPIIAGPDWVDPYIVPMPLLDPDNVKLQDLRVSFHTDNGIQTPTLEIAQVVTAAATVLADAGARTDETRPTGIESSYDIIMDAWYRCDPPLDKQLLKAAGTSREETTLQWIFDVPAATDEQIVNTVTRMDSCRSQMLSFMENYDVILCPVNAVPAMKHGSESAQDLKPFSYTMTYNLTGWPGAVVRGGTSPEGLPIGIQIVGRPWREDIVLAVAQLLERELGGFQAPDL